MATEQNIGPILETFQRTEITEHHIYKRLAQVIKSPENAKILDQIADDELRHVLALVRGRRLARRRHPREMVRHRGRNGPGRCPVRNPPPGGGGARRAGFPCWSGCSHIGQIALMLSL